MSYANETTPISTIETTSNVGNITTNNQNGNAVDVNAVQQRKSGWVQFEEDGGDGATSSKSSINHSGPEPSPVQKNSSVPAVLNTETITMHIERSTDSNPQLNTDIEIRLPTTKSVEFANVRQGFVNGDVVVTLLPVNTKWPWITPAQFRPELVPEELMAQGLTLTVEEYVHAMELLVNDYRFTMYNICYKRVLVCWISLAFVVLLALLFSGMTGLLLFILGVMWLILNAAAIFLCMWLKLKLSRGLEHCLARVNKLLARHKLVVALDDRGKISCHKVNLCFLYLDSGPCIAHLQQFIDREEGGSIPQGWERRLDVTANDIVIQGTQTTRLSRKQERAALTYLRYAARWGKEVLCKRLDLSSLNYGRHGPNVNCPCQFVEDHLKCKPPPGILKFFTLPDQRGSNHIQAL